MAVITISRETGCGGSGMAATLASRLGWHLADKETIGKILAEYGFVNFKETYDTIPSFWTRFDAQTSAIVSMLDRATLGLARHGNIVILGRGSFAVLSGYQDVLNIRLKAAFNTRVMRYQEEHAVQGFEEAERAVRESDRVRRAFVESFYTTRWDDASRFDLVLDTSRVSQTLCADWILQAIKELPLQGKHTPAVVNGTIESTMASVITKVLNCSKVHAI